MTLLKRTLALLILFASLVIPTIKPLAQGGAISPTIGVSPTKFLESIKPGVKSEYSISLRNYGQDPLPLAGSIEDIATIQESGVPIFTDKITPHSASSWLEIVNKDVIISPGEQQQVKVVANVPANLPPGSYHGAVVFQAKLPSYYFDLDSDARILPAVSVLFFLTIESDKLPTVENLEINDFEVPKIVVSTPLSVIANIKNPSNFYVQADAKATISGGLSNKTTTEDIGRVILLPEDLRKFVSGYSQKLLPGLYTATLQLTQGDKVLVASAKFIALPWQFLLWFFLAVFTILFLAFRRRFRHAYRVLVGKELEKPRRNRPTLR